MSVQKAGQRLAGACLRLAIFVVMLAAGCTVGANPEVLKPPVPQWPQKQTLHEMHRVARSDTITGAFEYAATPTTIQSQQSDAYTLWVNNCNIRILGGVPTYDEMLPVGGYSPWDVVDIDQASNLPQSLINLTSRDLSNGDIKVYWVRSLQTIKDEWGKRKRLGGIALTSSTPDASNPPHVFLAGQDLETARRVFAHELGHVFISPEHSLDPFNLMYRDAVSTATKIESQQCQAAQISPFARPYP